MQSRCLICILYVQGMYVRPLGRAVLAKSVPEKTPPSEGTADSQFQIHRFTILSPLLSLSDNWCR
jgi:hypothetical protein